MLRRRHFTALFALHFRYLFGLEQVLQFGHELLDIFEIEVDRGEADVCHFVIAPQAVHDQFADFAGLAFAFGRIR